VADPVGLTEIAARLGVPYGTVKKWRQRYSESWPKSQGTVGGIDWYEWEEVMEWCRKTGRDDLLSPKEDQS
jgi:transposase